MSDRTTSDEVIDMRDGATVTLEIDNINFDDGYVTFKLPTQDIRWCSGRYEILFPKLQGDE